MGETGVVFDIQRFALHDGPGIRTTVFFAGCSNRCGWCHNPESLSMAPQLQYYPLRCVGCGLCAAVCGRHRAVGGAHTVSRSGCTGCGRCVEVCNTHALAISGKVMTVSEVMAIVLEDRAYYAQSGGGVTLSGGEPVLQHNFCLVLLCAARDEGLHTVLETAGNYPHERVAPLARYLDLVLFDLKAWSDDIYERHIGARRTVIIAALKKLDETGVPLAVRTPVVGGVNDSEHEIEKIARFATSLKHLRYYQLLPYHALGKAKYEALGKPYDVPYATPSKEHMAALEQLAARIAPARLKAE